MNDRTQQLRQTSLKTDPSISSERAELLTRFYQTELGKHSVPVLRALAFEDLCQHKTIYLGPTELIVGERGPQPKAVPTQDIPRHSCTSCALVPMRRRSSPIGRVDP